MKYLKIAFKIFGIILFTPLLLITVVIICFKLTPYDKNNLPQLKSGDIILQSHPASQSLAIGFASSTPYTHTGIIKVDSNDNPIVVEAVGPVREQSLDKWVNDGIGSRITILRVKNLDPELANKALDKATEMYGLPYDFLFTFDDSAIYCSELVYKAFKFGAGISLGKVEKVKDLNVDNFAVQNLIKQRWKYFPHCQNIDSFESCYKIIMEQELVTPDSLSKDPNVEIIYSNYGFFK
jgi:hypothetical protein